MHSTNRLKKNMYNMLFLQFLQGFCQFWAKVKEIKQRKNLKMCDLTQVMWMLKIKKITSNKSFSSQSIRDRKKYDIGYIYNKILI